VPIHLSAAGLLVVVRRFAVRAFVLRRVEVLRALDVRFRLFCFFAGARNFSSSRMMMSAVPELLRRVRLVRLRLRKISFSAPSTTPPTKSSTAVTGA
tara:strand:+ start:4816 stop:5106 length:291 start_codon:yes stop_codon:yes gene_type:complete